MDPQDTIFKNPLVIRCAIIAVITLLLLIPLTLLRVIVDERAETYQKTVAGIANDWGGTRVLSGPVLVIPYTASRTVTERDPEDRLRVVSRVEQYSAVKLVLPRTVAFDARLDPETRYRSIYEYVVYSSDVSIQGAFQIPPDSAFAEQVTKVHWDRAYVSLGVNDQRALVAVKPTLTWAENPGNAFLPGTQIDKVLGPGIHANVAMDAETREYPFSITMKINGSGGMFFTPVGETTAITMAGAWPAPNFEGGMLPEQRDITAEGFTANWQILQLARNYPQFGNLEDFVTGRGESKIAVLAPGVSLHEPVSLYQLVTRAVKYGILFIGLTFVVLLAFELVSRRQLHVVQYAFVGVAMSVFYLMLLSLSEHVVFWQAFLLASLVSVMMNALYIAAALRSRRYGITLAGLLACLYLVLYVLLQLEGFTLLVGTAVVVAGVGAMMYLTRNLNAGSPPLLEKNGTSAS